VKGGIPVQITLKAARVNAGLTQEEIASKIHVNKATIINWEKGKTSPSAVQFEKICMLYNVKKDDIFIPLNPLKV
jgi:DNA-binding XRE family transcriptional regulator